MANGDEGDSNKVRDFGGWQFGIWKNNNFMKWKSKPNPEHGDVRRRNIFPWIPEKYGANWYWLESVLVEEEYRIDVAHRGWWHSQKVIPDAQTKNESVAQKHVEMMAEWDARMELQKLDAEVSWCDKRERIALELIKSKMATQYVSDSKKIIDEAFSMADSIITKSVQIK